MERRPDGTLVYRLGQPLHQLVIILLVALAVAVVFIYGAVTNEKPVEAGGEIWASAGVMNIGLGLAGAFAFAIAFPLMLALRARLEGKQAVRLEARRIVLAGVHRKGPIHFQYADIASVEMASLGLNKFVLVKTRGGERMTIPVPLFRDQDDPHRLIRALLSRAAC